MTKSKNTLIIALTSFCLMATLFVTTPISGSPGPGDYDPWTDLNDDGIIDIFDIVQVAVIFGTSGTPFAGKAALQYDSGWMDITDKCGQNITITHNLNLAMDAENWGVSIIGKTALQSNDILRNIGFTGSNQISAWNKTYGGTNYEVAYSVVQTSDGGFALAGYTLAGFWLVKTDSAGNMEWNKTYSKGSYDKAYSLVQTDDGGYAIAGRTGSDAPFGYDFWLVKTDASGNAQWNRTYGSYGSFEEAYSLVQTDDGGYAIAGAAGSGNRDFWLVRTDSNGNMMWNKTYDCFLGNNDEAYSIVQTSDGGYALTGRASASTYNSGLLWLLKTNESGDMQWNRTYPLSGTGMGVGYSVVQTSDGGYALAGGVRFSTEHSWDACLVKTDSNGNMLWSNIYGKENEDWAYSVVQTNDGGYALAGKTETYAGAWLLKTDSNGYLSLIRIYRAPNYPVAYSVVQTSDGGYALAGGGNFVSDNNDDFFLAKESPESGVAATELGLAQINSTANTLILHRGATDPYWNYVRVRIWKQRTP